MTDESVIPLGEFQPTCPQCGANLLIEQDGVEAKPDDRVFCVEHGTVGTREAIRAQVFEQNRDRIESVARDYVRDVLKRSGFTPK